MPFISNGTTILDNGAFSVGLGSKILLATSTASASASISFTTGIDSTYKAYEFVFVNIHPATDNTQFQFNLSTDSGSNYNVTKTTTFFRAYHSEGGASPTLSYETSLDLAQSTSFQSVGIELGNASDENSSGTLILFNPSSTTYVKHFITNTSINSYHDYSMNNFIAGYGNTTSAVNAIQFKMSSGNIDAGTIKMYGIKG
jgi:hypothetical protein